MTIQKKTFNDIDAMLIRSPITKDLAVRTDARAISFAIKNLILTLNGERPFNYNLGSPIRGLIFELYGDQMCIVMKQIIIDVIRNYEPRADLLDVTITDALEKNSIYITIIYRIKNTQSPIEVTVTLERTR